MLHDNATVPESDLLTRLSRNIAKRRTDLGLTQAQLAERLGVDSETVSRFERGRHAPSLLTLERLAGLLYTTAGELLAEAPKAPDSEATAMSCWLDGLGVEDRAFVRGLLKDWCDYLQGRRRSL